MPRQRELERDVCVVVEGAVGVAEGIVGGESVQAPDGLPVGDVVGADHPRIADVDHAGVGDVEGDSKAEQERAGEAQPDGRRRRPKPLPGAAEPHPEHPREEIDERRVGERHADADVGGVEEDRRDAERQQDQQVEVDDPPLAAQVEQAEQENRRERQPDVGGVQLVAELFRVAASHLPGDLVAGPRLAHRPGGVVDDHLHPLRPAVIEVHLPGAGLGLRGGAEPPVAPALLGDLGIGASDANRPGLVKIRRRLAGSRRGGRRRRRPRLRRRSRAGRGGSLPKRRGGQRERDHDGGDERRAAQADLRVRRRSTAGLSALLRRRSTACCR